MRKAAVLQAFRGFCRLFSGRGGQKQGTSWHLAIIMIMAVVVTSSCGSSRQPHEGRLITDSAGRQVTIPDTIKSVIALKSGTLRLLSYMKVTHLVSHIEGSEQRRNVLYLFANPHLRELPPIGAGNNYDTELLAAAAPDLILATFMSPREADRLEQLTRRPVVLLEYGDLGARRTKLYGTLTLLGRIFHREERADTLISYIETTIEECSRRAAAATEEPCSAYIGGVAYNGAHGITSTEPDYPPFAMLSVNNVAARLGLRVSSDAPGHEVVFIDPEQLIQWNPDVLFLDAAGSRIWEEELSAPSVFSSMKALQEGQAYTVLPYNWNTTNYENLLCNAWYIGSLLMPSAFGDVDAGQKGREVMQLLYGPDIYDRAVDYYQPFRQYIDLSMHDDQSSADTLPAIRHE
ncbi:MAG: ABC transporter substrate-binding protein [Bacteroidales bacterium]|nr:ABC transporter substrate-binding protein [Bacteroidales bacterium]MCB9029085.1 ABC transporter substrate-binding protein [Bacteroidales bacterium]HOO66337.1 ABC transporter substrate-binding protein [Bacteroidales bacterium]HPE22399.1 ABC transporter substrate-binding protein [Bacteroidales bacterium]HPJ05240.1 ABC transporter substrate-binding protein [Bacteroidales bacterium]